MWFTTADQSFHCHPNNKTAHIVPRYKGCVHLLKKEKKKDERERKKHAGKKGRAEEKKMYLLLGVDAAKRLGCNKHSLTVHPICIKPFWDHVRHGVQLLYVL